MESGKNSVLIVDDEKSSLLASFRELWEKYERRKEEIRALLEETEGLKKKAAAFLKKANRMTVYLTGRQRQTTGVLYHPPFFDSCLTKKRLSPLVPLLDVETEMSPAVRELGGQITSPNGLKRQEVKILRLIDGLKKNLLALDLLETRCRELLLSVNKAMEAFTHEYRLIRRRVYPLWVLSAFYKSLRRLRGLSYFLPRDLKELTALGELTGHILKLVDSPIL